MPVTAMPPRQTSTPIRVAMPAAVGRISISVPSTMGGMSVPKAAQYPRAMAMPSEMPR